MEAKQDLYGKEVKHMANFLVKVTADLPYPVDKEFRVSGWDFGTAIRRAVESYRKELKSTKGKAKQIDAMRVQATRL